MAQTSAGRTGWWAGLALLISSAGCTPAGGGGDAGAGPPAAPSPRLASPAPSAAPSASAAAAVAPDRSSLDAAVRRGVAFILRGQLPSGEFRCDMSGSADMSQAHPAATAYVTTYVAHALRMVGPMAGAADALRKATAFIERERRSTDAGSSWNYLETTPSPVPDDVDDTSVAAAALLESGRAVRVVDFERERAASGAYATWLSGARNEVDCGVNANVLFYESLAGERDDRLCAYLAERIARRDWRNCSVYFVAPEFFPYAVARAFADGRASCLSSSMSEVTSFLLSTQHADGSWGTDLSTAYASAALLDAGYRGRAIDQAVAWMLGRQSPDGAWASSASYTDSGVHGPGGNFYGSPELTTAMALEALSKYRQAAGSADGGN
jgi:hypothetical protein